MSLLQVDPDLGRFLPSEEVSAARQLAVPALTLGRAEDGDVVTQLKRHGAFGAIVLEGMLVRQVKIADHLGMRLLGPGDLIATSDGPPSLLVDEATLRALPGTRVATLGRELLYAAQRWPSLIAGLQLRWGQQTDRLTSQLVVCQLPRVDQRLLALMWLLAESWGRVTPVGTVLPLRLTHDALGSLIGARRPTVTLALRELADRGAIVRQDQGWLLLEPPPGSTRPSQPLRAPVLTEDLSTGADRGERATEMAENLSGSYAILEERVEALHEEHVRNRARFSEHQRTLAATRARCEESRARRARDRIRRRSRPSS